MSSWFVAGVVSFGGFGVVSSFLPALAIFATKLRDKVMYQAIVSLSLLGVLFLMLVSVTGVILASGIKVYQNSCVALDTALNSSAFGASMALLFICIDRYLAVVYALRYEGWMAGIGKRFIQTGPWLSTLIFAMIWPFYLKPAMSTLDATVLCNPFQIEPKVMTLISMSAEMTAGVLTMVLTVMVSFVASRVGRRVADLEGQGDVAGNAAAAQGVVSKVILLYTVLFAPYLGTCIAEFISYKVPNELKEATVLASIFFFLLDGWVFGFCNEDLNKVYYKGLRWICPCLFSQEQDETTCVSSMTKVYQNLISAVSQYKCVVDQHDESIKPEDNSNVAGWHHLCCCHCRAAVVETLQGPVSGPVGGSDSEDVEMAVLQRPVTRPRRRHVFFEYPLKKPGQITRRQSAAGLYEEVVERNTDVRPRRKSAV